MRWETLTSAEIGSMDKSLPVLLNLAAIEQHGPHLPLNTDAVIGDHLLSALDNRQPGAQLILPQVKVCCSAHHMDFPGTLSVPHRVLMDYVGSILDSVLAAGFHTLLIVNSHGGNQAIGQVIVEDFGARHPGCTVALVTWWHLARDAMIELSETGPFGTGHACELETSLMMAAGAIPPDLPLPAGEFHVPTFEWANGSMLHGAPGSIYRSMRTISGGSGTVGQPDAASLEKGQRITRAVTEKLATVISDLSSIR
ncbi:MAG: creatininase family protein [Nitratireductor sp.]|nr:creatininase family protein [Nitratireductor sp.]